MISTVILGELGYVPEDRLDFCPSLSTGYCCRDGLEPEPRFFCDALLAASARLWESKLCAQAYRGVECTDSMPF